MLRAVSGIHRVDHWMTSRFLLCFRLYQTGGLLDDGLPDPPYDLDHIAGRVESLGGHWISGPIYIDYFVPDQHTVIVMLAWPDLVRMPVLDYYI